MQKTVKDNDWIKRLKSEGRERETAIVELTELLVRGLSRSLSHRYGGAVSPDDIAQVAIMKILASLDQFEGRSRFTTWAMTIATRVGISELRRKHFQDVSLHDLATSESGTFEPVSSGSSVDVQLDRETVLATLDRMIETELTEKQRQAIAANLNGMPVEEIARRMESNRNAVYKLIHDARMRLRNGFEKAGITPEDFDALFFQ